MAQTTFELIPTAGYTFPSQTNFAKNYGRIEESLNLGGSIMINPSRGFGIELMYNRVDAKTGLYNYGEQSPTAQGNVVINYMMAGPVISAGGMVRPFIGALAGGAIFSPGPIDNSNNIKFAWGGEAGASIYAGPRFGIRLKAQVLSVVQGNSGGYYFGNFGSGAVSSTYSAIYQFGFSAGLIIGLGEVLGGSKEHEHYYYSPYSSQPNYR